MKLWNHLSTKQIMQKQEQREGKKMVSDKHTHTCARSKNHYRTSWSRKLRDTYLLITQNCWGPSSLTDFKSLSDYYPALVSEPGIISMETEFYVNVKFNLMQSGLNSRSVIHWKYRHLEQTKTICGRGNVCCDCITLLSFVVIQPLHVYLCRWVLPVRR